MLRVSILFLLLSFGVQAEESKRIAIGFMRAESVKDKDLKKNESLYTFRMRSVDASVMFSKITYSIDGKEKKVMLDNGEFSVKTTPGKHKFQIYISENYYEAYSDSLRILGGYHDTYNVYFQQASIEVIMDKPIIYLYPEEKTNAKVEVDVNGSLSFTYPEYKDAWEVTANPDGSIIHEGNEYNYLFWEGRTHLNRSDINTKSGYIISGDDVVSFLEKILNEAGFSSKERADFITYWGPRMIQYDRMFVRFDQNEQCKQFATLKVEPKPDHINQFYMTWFEIDEEFKTGPQIIEPINRDGFSVLEWGGQEIRIGKIAPNKIEVVKKLDK
jgi:hypothetical protein